MPAAGAAGDGLGPPRGCRRALPHGTVSGHAAEFHRDCRYLWKFSSLPATEAHVPGCKQLFSWKVIVRTDRLNLALSRSEF